MPLENAPSRFQSIAAARGSVTSPFIINLMPNPPSKSRVVIKTSPPPARSKTSPPKGPRSAELIIAVSIIGAAALATLFALLLTSRPYDPMNVSLSPQSEVPQVPSLAQPSAKPSATLTPSPPSNSSPTPRPSAEATPQPITPPDDTAIQEQIEKALAADPQLSDLDVSTLVESGKVTLVGSVRSNELKQRVEKTIRPIKGVSHVDNQLVVNQATPN